MFRKLLVTVSFVCLASGITTGQQVAKPFPRPEPKPPEPFVEAPLPPPPVITSKDVPPAAVRRAPRPAPRPAPRAVVRRVPEKQSGPSTATLLSECQTSLAQCLKDKEELVQQLALARSARDNMERQLMVLTGQPSGDRALTVLQESLNTLKARVGAADFDGVFRALNDRLGETFAMKLRARWWMVALALLLALAIGILIGRSRPFWRRP
jgi:hypothetical protein